VQRGADHEKNQSRAAATIQGSFVSICADSRNRDLPAPDVLASTGQLGEIGGVAIDRFLYLLHVREETQRVAENEPAENRQVVGLSGRASAKRL